MAQVIDLRDVPAGSDSPRQPLRLRDEIERAAALVIHALALGSVALIGGVVARLVQTLT